MVTDSGENRREGLDSHVINTQQATFCEQNSIPSSFFTWFGFQPDLETKVSFVVVVVVHFQDVGVASCSGPDGKMILLSDRS